LVGQNELQAMAILAAAGISLAAQHAPDRGGEPGTRFFVLDGTPPENVHAGFFARVAGALPHRARVGGVRDTAAVMGEVAAEVARRQAAGQSDAPAWYLLIHDVQRFRDLRKKEDDFGFSRSGEEQASPSQQLVDILREGPNLGIHVFAWCDSLTNLQRTFDRQALREVEMRVLFQMSQNDSSTLIDSPIASRLGEQRALFHSEEQGSMEKFRPYGLPPEEWLGWVATQLSSRVPPEPEPPAAAAVAASPSPNGDSDAAVVAANASNGDSDAATAGSSSNGDSSDAVDDAITDAPTPAE
ncbi:MAG TPA: hypothetical protein VFW87_22220, partial [Pirellulales bacterium]|nr:hypothetical protein [Pirellulales bacterium]